MTDTKHTPGPWTASEGYPSSVWHVDMPGRTFSITVSIDDDEERDVPDEETEANARLIAAAPELLAALADKQASPSVWCSECKGSDVQHLDWVRPNDGEIVGDYPATWRELKNNGESYCNDCQDHTLLTHHNPNERTD